MSTAVKIEIPGPSTGALVHRFQNFGEAIYRALRDDCTVNLEEAPDLRPSQLRVLEWLPPEGLTISELAECAEMTTQGYRPQTFAKSAALASREHGKLSAQRQVSLEPGVRRLGQRRVCHHGHHRQAHQQHDEKPGGATHRPALNAI